MFTTSTTSAAPTTVPNPRTSSPSPSASLPPSVSSPPPPPPALAIPPPSDIPARRVTSKSSLRSLRSLGSSVHDDDNLDPDADTPHTLDPDVSDRSLIRPSILKRLSPGLAARVKLLDGSNKNATSGRASGAVGRIPEEQIKELDSQHQDLSIRILKKGRAWHGLHLSSKHRHRQTSADYEGIDSDPDLVPQEPTLDLEPATSVPDSSATGEQPDPTIVDSPPVPDEPADSPATMSAADPLPTPTMPQPAMHSSHQEETDFEKYVKDTRDSETMPPPPPPKDGPPRPTSSSSAQMSAFFTKRPPSIFSFGSFRVSFLTQVGKLTSIPLPDPFAFQSSIQTIPTAPGAIKAIIGAGENVQRWIQKAMVVLGGLEVDGEVEWAAAGGREGVEEIDRAISQFDNLIHVYVKIIEHVQVREDIGDVSSESLETVVSHMDAVLQNWAKVKSKLREIKGHIELAMEWEELWDTVFSDVEREVDQLSQLLFEVQSKRHMVMTNTWPQETNHNSLDISELETIVEETPSNGGAQADKRLSVGSIFAVPPTLDAPIVQTPQEDGGHSDLIAVFARLQPLKASIQFLPMRLSMFQSRAENIYPSACADVDDRRRSLEDNFKSLEEAAETLRKEFGEDRWILVFRNAGSQAQKMFESVERSIIKLQDGIESGAHVHNPGGMAKRVESYEAKKQHYIPAIERVITIIQKGVADRLTVNGETITLIGDMKNKIDALKASIKVMDASIEDLNLMSSQQLRDSISTIVTMDSPATGSVVDTPGSSPASSVIVTPAHKGATTPLGSSSRRGSSVSSAARSTLNKVRRYSGLPQPSSTLTMKKSAIPKLVAPSPVKSNIATTPTPAARRAPARPSSALDGRPRWNMSTNTNDLNDYRKPAPVVDKRPRWNSSTNTNDLEVGHSYRPSPSPSPFRKFSASSRMSRPSSTLPGMSRRDHSPSPAPSTASRIPSRLGSRSPGRTASPLPPRSILDPPPYSKLRRQPAPPQDLPKTPRNRQSYAGASFSRSVSQETRALFTPKADRPGTALGHSGSRRISLLPLPNTQSGRNSAAGNRSKLSQLSQRPAWR